MVTLSKTETELSMLSDDTLALFRTVKGRQYDNQATRLMIVGRATHGAAKPTPDFSWIKPYFETSHGLTRSAFWRTTGKILSMLYDVAPKNDWYENIVWTNLFRIAPKDGGNPSKKLADKQKKLCIQAHREDIDAHKPTHIIYMTGWDWMCDFQPGLTFSPIASVESYGIINNYKIVVLQHPQGKKEDVYVNDAIHAIEMLKGNC